MIVMRTGKAFLLGLWLVAACKTRDPLYCDEQTQCEAGYEACDLTAACTELRNTCLMPSDVCWDAAPGTADAGGQVCEPDTFIECAQNGDVVACNSEGTAEVTLPCESGCNADSMGCNDCVPNSSVCESGTATICSATGAVLSMNACPLGCHGGGTRCNDLDPSNGLAVYLDDAPDGPDLVLVDGSTINTATGEVFNGPTPVTVPSVLLDAPAGGVAVRVFKVNSLWSGDLVVVTGGATIPALAIVAHEDVDIVGDLILSGAESFGLQPGAFFGTSACHGGDMDTDFGRAGPGGAGFGGPGASGGAAGGASGRSGGMTAGNVAVVPLRGGCRGGSLSNFATPIANELAHGGNGGGAIQIASRTRIRIGDSIASGSIQANGLGGGYSFMGGGGGGGGSGGAILLEAPVVEIAASSGVAANGGAGSCGNMDGGDGLMSETPAIPADCTSDFGDGGPGGTVAAAPGNGASGSGANPVGGGGGGAVGRIRINTASGNYSWDGSSVRSPLPTTGTAALR